MLYNSEIIPFSFVVSSDGLKLKRVIDIITPLKRKFSFQGNWREFSIMEFIFITQ